MKPSFLSAVPILLGDCVAKEGDLDKVIGVWKHPDEVGEIISSDNHKISLQSKGFSWKLMVSNFFFEGPDVRIRYGRGK